MFSKIRRFAALVLLSSVAFGAPPADHAEDAPGRAAPAPTAGATLTTTGTYTPAPVTPTERAAFGPSAGKAHTVETPAEPAPSTTLYFYLFAASAAACALLTLGGAWHFSRTTTAQGTPAHAWTIGTKLAGGFGASVTGILLLATVAANASRRVEDATANSEYLNDQCTLVNAMDIFLLDTRIAVKGFLISNQDADLKKYSDSTASLHDAFAAAQKTIRDPERVSMVTEIGAAIEEYEHKFSQVVGLIDQINTVIDVQLFHAGSRAGEILATVSQQASATDQHELARAALQARGSLYDARVMVLKFLRSSDPAHAQAAIKHAESLRDSIGSLANLAAQPATRTALAEAAEAATFYIARMEHAKKLQDERNQLVHEGLDAIGPRMAALNVKLAESLTHSKHEVLADADRVRSAASLTVVVIAGVSAVLAGILSVVTIRGITGPLGRVVHSLKTVAGGDLTVTALNLRTHDEVGTLATASDTLADSLRTMVKSIKGTSNDVAAAATEVAASAEELAQTVRTQEQSATQVASAVSELASSVAEVADKSSKAAISARDSAQQAGTGGDLVRETVSQLGQINQRVGEVATAVSTLETQGTEVGRIVQVIEEIAEQTNLLALNAAIEAARAGEHGRGFAVVADEVRKLAERTTQATAEVGKTIGSMQQETSRAAEAMKVGRETVAEGARLGERAGVAVTAIVSAQTHAESLSGSIAAATQQQATATEEISRTIDEMTASNRQSADAAGQAAQAAGNLSHQAETLRQYMERFKV